MSTFRLDGEGSNHLLCSGSTALQQCHEQCVMTSREGSIRRSTGGACSWWGEFLGS